MITPTPTTEPYSTGNTISLQITFPSSFSLSGSYLILCPSLFFYLMCLTVCQKGEKETWHKYHIGAHHAVETSTLRKERRDGRRWRKKEGTFPSRLAHREGVSHPVERHNAKWLFLPILLWGSTEVRHLSWLVRCMEILHSLLSDKNRCVLFQFSRLGAHFRTEYKVKGGGGVIHYECMNSLLYNCLWSDSRLVET